MNKHQLIIILGPPGIGKTAVADRLAEFIGYEHISWGQLRRKHTIAPDVPASKLAGDIIRETLGKMIQRSKSPGIILEGYPHTADEAEAILQMLADFDIALESVVALNSSYEVLAQLQDDRRFCPDCQQVYRESQRERCPKDGAELLAFQIDMTQFKEDYYTYHTQVNDIKARLAPLADSSFDIDADQDIRRIVSQILIGLEQKHKYSHVLHSRVASSKLRTKYGEFRIYVYQSKIDYSYHLALVRGEVEGQRAVPVRVHSSCITGDILGSQHCECGEQLQRALEVIAQKESGILLYLFQEGRGINIINKIKAYDLQAAGMDTVEANEALGLPGEMRGYESAHDILVDLGPASITLLTNNPDKMTKLKRLGVVIESIEPIEIESNDTNRNYLETKKTKMSHRLRLKRK